MHRRTRGIVVAVGLVAVFGSAWALHVPRNLVAGVAAVLLVSIASQWVAGPHAAAAGLTHEEAVEYLARETLRYWRRQAQERGLRETPLVAQLRQRLHGAADEPAPIAILGAAGSGKTSAMVLLLVDVLEARAPGG
jgi:hypothetical protein